MITAGGVSSPGAAGKGGTEPPAPVSPGVLDAARQFEALLVAQLLRAARGDGAGWLGTGEDHSSTPAMELAEEQLAAALAAQGGLGLARLIASGLKQP